MIQQSHFWVYLEKTLIWKSTCTPVFTAALFMIAKTWKQPECPSIDEWKKNEVHIYSTMLLSHKIGWNNAFRSNMDGPDDHAKIS